MAEKPTRRRRTTRIATATRRPRTAPAVTNSVADDLKRSLTALLEENATLRRQVERLSTSLSRIASLAQVEAGASAQAPVKARRGRPPRVASATAPEAAPVKRTRRRVTDPVALERRRQALAKARAVAAQNRAARAANA